MSHYAFLPYYRNYWRECGYTEEMTAIERAIAEGRNDDVPQYLTDSWLEDVTLFGPPAKVREGIEAWRDARIPGGVRKLPAPWFDEHFRGRTAGAAARQGRLRSALRGQAPTILAVNPA